MFGTLELNISKHSGNVRESSETHELICDIRKYFGGLIKNGNKNGDRSMTTLIICVLYNIRLLLLNLVYGSGVFLKVGF